MLRTSIGGAGANIMCGMLPRSGRHAATVVGEPTVTLTPYEVHVLDQLERELSELRPRRPAGSWWGRALERILAAAVQCNPAGPYF